MNLKNNLWRYPLFSCVAFTPVMLPVLVLFFQENGLDMFDVYALQGLFAVAVVLLEVPTGMVADRLGKRTSLLASTLILALGCALYAMGRTFWVFFLAEVIMALGISLLSGADTALLYDTLSALGRSDEYTKREGQARSWQMISFALCNLLGGLIGSYSYRATLWVSAIGPVLGFLLALGFVEAKAAPAKKAPRTALKEYFSLLSGALRFVKRHRLVRWQITFWAVLTGSASWLLWLYQPYMTTVGLPVWSFGFAFAGFNLFAALCSRQAYRVEEALGQKGTLVTLALLQVAPLILMALFLHPVAVVLILGHQAVRGFGRPIISERILRYTYADKRATVLSLGSLFGRLFFALTTPLVGWAAKHTTMSTSLLFQAAMLTLFLGALLLTYSSIPAKYFRVKESVATQQ